MFTIVHQFPKCSSISSMFINISHSTFTDVHHCSLNSSFVCSSVFTNVHHCSSISKMFINFINVHQYLTFNVHRCSSLFIKFIILSVHRCSPMFTDVHQRSSISKMFINFIDVHQYLTLKLLNQILALRTIGFGTCGTVN